MKPELAKKRQKQLQEAAELLEAMGENQLAGQLRTLADPQGGRKLWDKDDDQEE